MGAGTTAVAAKKLERSYIGFDVSAEYLATAERVLASTTVQQPLFTAELR
ncbi:DNA methyltransferase [Brevibacterium paucivorans]